MSTVGSPRPQLAELHIADPPGLWAALGFAVETSRTTLGGITVQLGGPGRGITAWGLSGVPTGTDIAGLPTTAAPAEDLPPTAHPNTAIAIDHVVVLTPDFDRTAEALERAGMPLRRIRDAGTFRQGFRRLGPAILELVEARDTDEALPRFWGLVIIVSDLDALAERLGAYLGPIRPAVQPGRRIATLNESAELSTKVAFMDPEPA